MLQRLISVIIPVYNRSSLIGETLSNLQENKYRPLEIILVNDASTDKSQEVLENFKKNQESGDFVIKIIHLKENHGAPYARNIGFKNSQGYYIQFLDSDDFIDEYKFHLQVQCLEKNNGDFCLCDFLMIFRNKEQEIYHSNKLGRMKVVFPSRSFGCGSPLLKRNLAHQVKWNEKLHRNQDMDYFLRTVLLANKVVYVKKALYFYIMHSGQRISDLYNSSDPVFWYRTSSLWKTKVKSKNLLMKYIAIIGLLLELLIWYIFKKTLHLGKRHS